MQNIKLTLQYDGTRYLGWKRPEKSHNDRTVSYKIENVLEKVTAKISENIILLQNSKLF